MRLLRTSLLALCLLSPAAFAEPVPVPAEKMAYVGDWQGKDMRLQLAKDGQVKYKRDRPGKKLDLSVDLQRFDGNDFEVGTSLIRSRFVVSKPPHREGDKWKMTVDGVELTRVD
ncbi:hypothetical protein G4G28_01875 [Massilia sp. Dwa41.01b]|uniref:hypothetical protein n=1 Tax=unclassified Massilia TaxID=2609279 RepID=UPI001601C528|nr:MULTISPECIES: hypothetical protein [unclassified Massilia]QNA87524.1 hypothetical protein G4G28_01875 [Massilia sp. Dwa41.01b]QNA98431.1 hypothetical protein G4G31_05640 [Massilia sp. Se16.2.3]